MATTTEFDKISEFLVPTRYMRYKIRFQRFWRLYTDSPFGLIGLYLVIFFLVIGVVPQIMAPYDPNISMTGARNAAPDVGIGPVENGKGCFVAHVLSPLRVRLVAAMASTMA